MRRLAAWLLMLTTALAAGCKARNADSGAALKDGPGGGDVLAMSTFRGQGDESYLELNFKAGGAFDGNRYQGLGGYYSGTYSLSGNTITLTISANPQNYTQTVTLSADQQSIDDGASILYRVGGGGGGGGGADLTGKSYQGQGDEQYLMINFKAGGTFDGNRYQGLGGYYSGSYSVSGNTVTLTISATPQNYTHTMTLSADRKKINDGNAVMYLKSTGGSDLTGKSYKGRGGEQYLMINFKPGNQFDGNRYQGLGGYYSGTYAVSGNTVTLTISANPQNYTHTMTLSDDRKTIKDGTAIMYLENDDGGDGGGGATDLTGKSYQGQGGEQYLMINFKAGGEFDGNRYQGLGGYYSGTYSVSGNTLTLTISANPQNYTHTMKLSPDRKKVYDGDAVMYLKN